MRFDVCEHERGGEEQAVEAKMRKKLGTRFPAVRSLPSDLLSCGRHPILSTVPAAVRAAQIFVSRRRDPDAAVARCLAAHVRFCGLVSPCSAAAGPV
jgi:hypothetical protein